MNFSTYNYDLERFDRNPKKISDFLKKYNMNGIELLNPIEWNKDTLPKHLVKGVHLRYYPTWLDFWNENKKALLEEFKNMDNVEKYYGGIHRDIMIQHYIKEIEMATKIGVEYMVFHVAHTQTEHAYNYDFTYSDYEVTDAAIDLLNEVFKNVDTNVKLLFENVWWPGFTMLDKNIAYRLLNKVQYKNKGFLLDTAHLINTNLHIRSEEEAIQYIINTVNDFGELKGLIKGMHLNCSLSGEYVMDQINKKKQNKEEFKLNPMSEELYMHVFRIDSHKPFTNKNVKDIINLVKPEYIVYELVSDSVEQLGEYIKIQNKICNI